MLYKQPVKQLMRPGAVRDIQETLPVSKALQIMDSCNISALPVRGSEGRYTGVISKSDIASLRFFKALEVRKKPEAILVCDVMNRTTPIYVYEEDPIQVAIHLMHKRHIHRIFVADADNQLTGVISTTDILRLLVVTE